MAAGAAELALAPGAEVEVGASALLGVDPQAEASNATAAREAARVFTSPVLVEPARPDNREGQRPRSRCATKTAPAAPSRRTGVLNSPAHARLR